MTRPIADGYSLAELAHAIDAHIHGSPDVRITGVNSLEDAKSGDLAFLSNDRLADAAGQSRASALIVSKVYPALNVAQLISPHPHVAFVELIHHFFTEKTRPTGIAKDIATGTDTSLGTDVSIGPFVALGHRTRIGNRVTIYPGVVIGNDVTIGDDAVLYPHVSVLDACKIGNRVIIHAGTVIGSDGFGYIQHEARHRKIPQRGIVVIDDDVEIGANVTIDRATFGRTHVKQGSKIDNQVQIAHNVTIGEHTVVVAQVGIAGSTSVGKHVMIGGQVGVIDHLTVGDRAKIAAGSGILKNVEPGAVVSGWPARRHEITLRTYALMHRLPELSQQVTRLEKRLAEMEAKMKRSKIRKTRKVG